MTDTAKTGAAADGYVVDNAAAAYPVFADPASVAKVFGYPYRDSEWESLKPASDAATAAEESTVFASGFRFVDPDPNHLYDPVPEDDADDVTLQQDYYTGSANYWSSHSYDQPAEEEPSSSRYYAPAEPEEPEYSEQDEYKKYSNYEFEEDDNVMLWLKQQRIKPKPAKKSYYYNSKPKRQQPRKEQPPTYYELHARDRYDDQERHYRADRYWYGDQDDTRRTQTQRSSQQAGSRKASPQQHSSSKTAPPARPGSSSGGRAAPFKSVDTGSKAGGRPFSSSPSFDRTRQLGATGSSGHPYGQHSKPTAKTTSTPAPADAAKVLKISQAAASILGDKGWRVISVDKAEDIAWLKAGVTAYNKNHAKPMYLLAWSSQ